jgi:uncharacterized Zn-binding protein involved in type VI secretion
MPAVQRVGDSDSGGGVVLGGVPSVRVNNRPVAIVGNPVTGHPPYKGPHVAPVTAAGSPNVRAAGIPICRTGDPDSCGHSRSGGSPNVKANG